MYTFRISFDNEAEDPLTWTGNIVLISFHKRYRIGHHHGYKPSDYNGEDALKKAIRRDRKPTAIYPLYMYEHGAIALSLDKFSCDFDSGQIGYLLYSNPTDEKPITKKKREIYLRSFLREYNQFLNGQVYMYTIYDKNGQEIHSEGNYYTRQQAETDAKDKIAYLLGEDSFFNK